MITTKRLAILALCLGACPLFSQPRLALSASGDGNLALGDDAAIFSLGYGGSLRASFPLGAGLELSPSFSFLSEPLAGESGKAISSFSLGAGLYWRFLRLGPLGASLFAGGGGYAATLTGSGWDFNPLAYGGLRLDLPGLAIQPSLEAGVRTRLGLSTGLALSAGFAVPLGRTAPREGPKAVPAVPAAKPATLELVSLELDRVFPVFYKYYDDHPLGTLVLRNVGALPISGVEATFFARQFMDNPKAARGPSTIEPGAEARYELYGLFSDSILSVSEGTKVSVNLSVAGTGAAPLPLTATLEVYDRNASTWDDDRRVAAFVTAKDPLVLKFAKNGLAAQDEGKRRRLAPAIVASAAAFESLRLYGMRYSVDPASSYSALSAKDGAVDFLQFPRQTLDFKAGDCDDLSILYCALLESLGAETAFVTIPGHIYAAVELGIAPAEAAAKLSRPQDAIESEGRLWLPVEVTALGGDFLAAWELGAREWREAKAQGNAALYPLREAWKTYAPVGLASEKAEASPPPADKLAAACAALYQKFAEREAGAFADRVRAEMKKSGESARLINKLGAVYASYGMDDKAESQFRASLAKQDNASAAYNLGNLAFLAGNAKQARDWYLRAYKKNQQDPNAILAMARVSRELDDRAAASDYYQKLKKMAPALAERNSWLEGSGDEAARAAAAADVGGIVWAE